MAFERFGTPMAQSESFELKDERTEEQKKKELEKQMNKKTRDIGE